VLLKLFAIGAGGTIVFMRMRGNPEVAVQSPLAAILPSAPRSSMPPAIELVADATVSGPSPRLGNAPMQIPMQTARAMPTPAQENELQIPQQQPPASSALTRPAQSMLDAARSRGATDYLHSHRLPFVTVKVFSRASGEPASLTLSGQVATEFGREDAERQALKFLGVQNLALDNQIQVEPNLATREIPPGNQNSVIKLPNVFNGCWELVNDQQNGPVHLQAGASEGCIYTHDSGRFCYQRGADGNYAPSFSSLRLSRLYGTQSEQWSRLELVSTDGVSSMRMRFLLHHKEGGILGFLFGSTAIDETHEFSCRVYGDTMHCEDSEFGRIAGQPWCSAAHLDEFKRVANVAHR
jgi:hypothetical protein